jgi:acid phosphatase family membrane protein YuiD
MIVVYDASGVRRQAGIHAQKINQIFEEFLHGRPIEIDKLKVVMGHTPAQVVGGIILGILVSLVTWWIW